MTHLTLPQGSVHLVTQVSVTGQFPCLLFIKLLLNGKELPLFGLETSHLGSIVTHSLKNKCEERQTLLSSHCSHIDKTYFSPGMSRRLVNPVQLISKSCFLKRRESIKHLKYFQVSQQMQTGLCK